MARFPTPQILPQMKESANKGRENVKGPQNYNGDTGMIQWVVRKHDIVL
jgi:hypothetical protein